MGLKIAQVRSALWGVWAVAAATSAPLLSSGIAHAADARCQLPRGIGEVAGIVAQAERSTVTGLEHTDYFAGGAVYRTIACSTSGEFERSMVVATTLAPDGQPVDLPIELVERQGAILQGASMLYPDFTQAAGAKVWDAGGGRSAVASVLPAVPAPNAPARTVLAPPRQALAAATRLHRGRLRSRRPSRRPRRRAMAFAASDAGCTQNSYSFENLGWFSYAYHYRINSSIPSIPGNAHGQILSGHHVWNNTTNPCGYADLTSFTAYSDGNTTAHGGSNDGVNVVDFGSMSGGFSSCNTAGILACTLFWTTSSYMTGADIRFNSSVAWYATSGAPPSGYYDVYSTATHESGHALGLGHTSGGSTNYLTMYPFQCSGCIRERDLGRGDVNGLRALYP